MSINYDTAAIRHLPEGYYPGDRLDCDRVPRHPLAGQEVLIKAEVRADLAAAGAVLTYTCNGRKTEIQGRRIRDYHASRSELLPLPGHEGGPLDYFLFEMGSFAAGDEAIYEISAGTGASKAVTGPFRFAVEELCSAPASAMIYPTAGGALAIFGGEQSSEQSLELTFRAGRLHMLLSHERGLPGADLQEPRSAYLLTDPESGVTAELQAAPFHFTVKDRSGRLLFASPAESSWWLRRRVPGGKTRAVEIALVSRARHYYGFGERFDAIDQNGLEPDVCVVSQYTRQGRRTYYPVPFFLTECGYGLYVATDRYVRFGFSPRSRDLLTFYAQLDPDHPQLTLVFFFGSPREIVRSFTFHTGPSALPPKWALGPWMSGNSWNTQREVEEHLATAERLDIPSTVLVIEAWSDEVTFYLFNDARYQLKPGEQGFRISDFTFPADGKWPDPKGMIDRLHEHDMRLVLWQIPVLKHFPAPENPQHQADEEHVVTKGYCAQNPDGTPYRIPDGWFAGSLILDFTNPEAWAWWFAKRRYLLDELGVDGFKTDGGEFVLDDHLHFFDGSDGGAMRNRYPLEYIRAYHEFMGGKRLTFSRAGFTGGQQYPMYWAGDQVSTYEEFRAVVRAGLSLGLSGNAFWGFDIGGFSGDIPTADLYLRAAQTAAFCPVMQYHSESRGAENYDRTPWNMAARTGDERIVPIYRYFAWLRMNLLPHIHQQARLAATEGEPLMRALCLDFPEDPIALTLEDAYMFGRNLLVAPILEENTRERRLYLPAGDWLDFWTLEQPTNGWHDHYPCDLGRIPVFIRKGSIIPLNMGASFRLGCSTGTRGLAYGRLCFLFAGQPDSFYEFDDGEENRVSFSPDGKSTAVRIQSGELKEVYILSADEHPAWEKVGQSDWSGFGDRLNVYSCKAANRTRP